MFSFAGQPIPRELIEVIDARLQPFGCERAGRYVDPPAALLHRAYHVTPEDVLERQPHTGRCGSVVTWDGRLDNRDELLPEVWRELGHEPTDVAIAAEALSRWGVAGLRRLIGDWSLVAWNPRLRTITLASDYSGIRSLYYAERAGALHWSSSLAELTRRLGVETELDQRFIVGYLTGLNAPEVTPYWGVSAVPVGHALIWSHSGRVERQRFWQPAVGRLEYHDAREYAEAFRSVFRKAVASRLRATESVWAELSGGLDSSAIVCVADTILSPAQDGQQRLGTVSCVTDSSPESDERRFIASVEELRKKRGEQVLSESAVDSFDDNWGWVSPHHPSGKSLEMFRVAARHGGRVLLSGRLGDVVMSNTPEELGGILEALAEGRIRTAFLRGREWCLRTRRTVWDLGYHVALKRLPPAIRTRASIRELLSPFGVDAGEPVTAAAHAFHLTPTLARLWCETANARADRALPTELRSKRTMIADILDSTELRWLQSPTELAPVVYAHPYADRRLVEFMLRVPAHIASQPGRPRALMKEALAGTLPHRVLNRFSKGYADPLHLRVIKSRLPADLCDLDSWQVVRRCYVDRDHLRNALSDVRNGASRKLKNLLMVVSLERWLTTRDYALRSSAY